GRSGSRTVARPVERYSWDRLRPSRRRSLSPEKRDIARSVYPVALHKRDGGHEMAASPHPLLRGQDEAADDGAARTERRQSPPVQLQRYPTGIAEREHERPV